MISTNLFRSFSFLSVFFFLFWPMSSPCIFHLLNCPLWLVKGHARKKKLAVRKFACVKKIADKNQYRLLDRVYLTSAAEVKVKDTSLRPPFLSRRLFFSCIFSDSCGEQEGVFSCWWQAKTFTSPLKCFGSMSHLQRWDKVLAAIITGHLNYHWTSEKHHSVLVQGLQEQMQTTLVRLHSLT